MHEINSHISCEKPASIYHGIVLILASIMPAMAIISAVPVLPMLIKEFSYVKNADTLVPVALTIPALCVALFSPLAGWLADRVGRKRLLIISLFAYTGIGLLPLIIADFFLFFIARIGLGFAEAFIMTVATVLIGDYFSGKEQEKWIALQVAVVSLSAIILISAGGILGEWIGARGPFLLYILALPVAFLALFILFEPNKKTRNHASITTNVPLKSVLPMLLITLGVGILFYTIIVQLGAIVGNVGVISPAAIGIIGAASNIGVAVGSLGFKKSGLHAGPMILSVGLLLTGLGYVGAGLSTGVYIVSGFIVLASIGAGMMLSNMAAWTMRLLPSAVRGRGMGMWTSAFFFGQFLAPLCVMVVALRAGGLSQALLVYGACAGVAALWAYISAQRLQTGASA